MPRRSLTFSRLISTLLAALLASGCASDARNRADVPEIDRPDASGSAPLLSAAHHGDDAAVMAILDRGANPNARDGHDRTALMCLIHERGFHLDAVKALLTHHADPNLGNFANGTPLVLAAAKVADPADPAAELQLVTLLLAAGANPSVPQHADARPAHIAALHGQSPACVLLLLNATAKDEIYTNHDGYSVLSEAALGDHRSLEDGLIAAGLRPQDLPAAQERPAGPLPFVDESFVINARCDEAYGDYLAAQGHPAEATTWFQKANAALANAVAEDQHALTADTQAIAEEKSQKTKQILGYVAANAVGVGLAAATGVGFVVVPKPGARVDNRQTLEAAKAHYSIELARLRQQQPLFAAKANASPARATPPRVMAVLPTP